MTDSKEEPVKRKTPEGPLEKRENGNATKKLKETLHMDTELKMMFETLLSDLFLEKKYRISLEGGSGIRQSCPRSSWRRE